MNKTIPLLILLVWSIPFGLGQSFPYPVAKKTLTNGMDVIVIETPEFKDVLSYNTLVLAGARNETGKGKTGLAHLFEHILFRHRWMGRLNGYDQIINKIGAFNNAWTNFDVTYYHPLTFTFNLEARADRPSLPQLEAERFTKLDFSEEIFKTEAGAVLGEYRRNASNPGLNMMERLLALSFPDHSYGHSTIGYLEDVHDMPNEYQGALDFYSTYYRPNNVVLLVVGDVQTENIFSMADQLYGDWQPADQPVILEPGPTNGPKKERIWWEADVPPRVSYAYRMPAFNTSREGAIGQLLPELLAGETAPLFQKLRYEKKSASSLRMYSGHYESFHPRLLELSAVLFKEKYQEGGEAYFEDVITDMDQGFQDLKDFSSIEGSEGLLKDLKAKLLYDFLAILNSPANIAQIFAWYYRFDRDPQVLDVLMEQVQAVQPAEIDAFASQHFVEANRVIVTMAHRE